MFALDSGQHHQSFWPDPGSWKTSPTHQLVMSFVCHLDKSLAVATVMPITPQTEAAQLVLGHLDTLIPILSCLDDTEDIARASAVSRSWNIATQKLHLEDLPINLT
ncbi:TPA: hypothetical protein ACH3X1_012557 [Trebouxia sp. C0004]